MSSPPDLPDRGLRLTARFVSSLALLTGLFLLWGAWQRWLAMQPGSAMGQAPGELSPTVLALLGVVCIVVGTAYPGYLRRRYAAAVARSNADAERQPPSAAV